MYELHFTASDFDILSLDIMFHTGAYGAADYIVLRENDVARAYLSPNGMRECFELSTRLLDDAFVDDLFEKTEALRTDLHKYHLDTLTDANVYEQWVMSKGVSDTFCSLYRFYEQPFQQALEQNILDGISEDVLRDVLLRKSFDDVRDTQTKKYIKRLIRMGEMKLQLHTDGEGSPADTAFLEYVAKRHHLPIHLVGAMRVTEFEDVLQGARPTSVETLTKRLEGSVFVKKRDTWRVHAGKKYKRWRKKLHAAHSDKIVGNVAFPGVTTGRVVVHLSWNNITELQSGDVLVTGMTNPQMVPMLKHAAAMVTDEGGITCHAAILARELRIPCVTGTKNATKALRNGDLIEVDADTGSVRILERA